MIHTDQYARTVSDLGYHNEKKAYAAMDRHEVLSLINGPYGRCEQISKAKKFTGRFRPGDMVRFTLRYKNYRGTVLGFRRHRYRGWVMGILLKGGGIKDITIDPYGYRNCGQDVDEFDWIEDPNGKTISILSPQDLIVIVTKMDE